MMRWLLPPVETPGFQGSDANSYFAIAAGHPQDAYYYYGGRILYPLAARYGAAVTRLSLPDGFRLLSCLSLVVFIGALCLIVGNVALLPFLLVPGFILAFRAYYFPELFYAALTAVFFLVLSANVWLALPFLFALHITRESTVLLTVTLALVMARRNRLYALAVIVVGIAGLSISSALAARGLPNHHGIQGPLFDLLKVLYNIAHNLLGLVFWTDTNALTTDCRPEWLIRVHIGSIRQLGFCGFQWKEPATTIVALASSFGVLPLLIIRGRARLFEGTAMSEVATWYGALSLIAAPLIGTAVARYTLYAWPLFWIRGGDLLNLFEPREYLLFAPLVLLSAWLPVVVTGTFSILTVEALLYWLAYPVVGAEVAPSPGV